jgi:ubiquitin-like modifier-activating enzyme ATG7
MKLNKWRLSTEPRPIHGTYSPAKLVGLAPTLNVSEASFADEAEDPASSMTIRVPGTLHLVNTLEELKGIDKMALLREACEDIEASASDKSKGPSYKFVLIVHADVKRHKYVYWFCFPAAVFPRSVERTAAVASVRPVNGVELSQISSAVQALREQSPKVGKEKGASALAPVYILGTDEATSSASIIPWDQGNDLLRQLREAGKAGNGDDVSAAWADSHLCLMVFDPSSSERYPGWPLRSFANVPSLHFGARSTFTVFSVRSDANLSFSGRGTGNVPTSLRIEMKVSATGGAPPGSEEKVEKKVMGWELNERGKAGPRVADLGSTMDPTHLAMASADLNVKLMRWRMLPDLDTDGLKALKCLLLGAGTLGCAVARTLIGWGVRSISFVDNGTVSYSNPARQSLFTFEDCKSRTHKATAAAKALRTILPGMKAEGHVLTIPMPGHGFKAGSPMERQSRESYKRLKDLIGEHDVVFLGTDSRESRWLPTLMCVAQDKMCLNVALGFDNFLVMRHGHGHDLDAKEAAADEALAEEGSVVIVPSKDSKERERLGCYFCADIVAPGDSLTGRTLDQQCTVTRPGLAPCAAGLAVELMVALFSHPLKHRAAAGSSAGPLGILPHQIRGHMTSFTNNVAMGSAYDKCTACSTMIVDQLRKEGVEFVLKVLNEPLLLEEITGLADMKKSLDDMMEDFGAEDDDVWGDSDIDEDDGMLL